MSNKQFGLILLGVAILMVIGFGAWKLVLNRPETATTQEMTTSSSSSNSAESQTANDKSYSTREVAEHNTKSDCWTIINGNVYDVTRYISSHPGGDDILKACGQDATSLFTERASNSGESVGSGTPHSSSAQKQLDSLKIGVVKN